MYVSAFDLVLIIPSIKLGHRTENGLPIEEVRTYAHGAPISQGSKRYTPAITVTNFFDCEVFIRFHLIPLLNLARSKEAEELVAKVVSLTSEDIVGPTFSLSSPHILGAISPSDGISSLKEATHRPPSFHRPNFTGEDQQAFLGYGWRLKSLVQRLKQQKAVNEAVTLSLC